MAIFIIITLVYMYPLIIVDYCEFIIIFAFDAVAQSPPGNARETNLIITSCVTPPMGLRPLMTTPIARRRVLGIKC